MVDLSLHFQKPPEWAPSVFIHYWNVRPSGKGTTWPGTPMSEGAGDWFSVVLPRVAEIDLVFSDGAGRQTIDLHRNRDGWYDSEGRWHDKAPATSSEHRAGMSDNPSAAAPVSSRVAEAPFGETDFREETIYFLGCIRVC